MRPAIGQREVVYENKYQRIARVPVQFDGYRKELFVNSYGKRVGLVLVRNGEILLVRQWRLLVQDLALEIPGGRVDEGETPEQAAIREGLEETALRCRELKSLLYYHPGLDTFDNPTYLFYSDAFEEVSRDHLHAHEVTDHVWIPLPKCIEMIFSGKIVDSMTIAALLAYKTRLENPNLPSS